MAKDYYIVLGVSRGADTKKIKDAYRTIVKRYHPDASQDLETTKNFLEVKEAYETLGDEEKRKRYDEELAGEGSELRVRRVPEIVRERKSRFENIESVFSRTDDFFSGFLPGFFDVEKTRAREKDLYFEAVLTPGEGQLKAAFSPSPSRCSKSARGAEPPACGIISSALCAGVMEGSKGNANSHFPSRPV